MICILALIVFALLGIFSAKYRKLAKESLKCFFYKIRGKPCPVGLDKKIRLSIALKFSKFPRIAKFWYKNYEIISFVILVLLLGSFGYSVYSVINFISYGSCDPHSTNCIFNPTIKCGGQQCKEQCLCEEEICESPEYMACEGDCDCQREVCGG